MIPPPSDPPFDKPVLLAATPGLRDVIAERQRQIHGEGWSSEHDDAHRASELARAAMALIACSFGLVPTATQWWPFDPTALRAKGARRDLVRAAALLIAEIERLDRRPPVDGAPGRDGDRAAGGGGG
jgi:hypothetical protein